MSSSPSSADASCIFCKIIKGEIPCAKVYEDQHVLAFLDVNPISVGHVLVVPKGHYPTLLDVPFDTGGPLINAMRLVAEALRAENGASGINCVQNNFSSAGQVVFHAHWHIIPRFENDGLCDWPTGKNADSAALQQLAKSLSARIAGASAGGIL